MAACVCGHDQDQHSPAFGVCVADRDGLCECTAFQLPPFRRWRLLLSALRYWAVGRFPLRGAWAYARQIQRWRDQGAPADVDTGAGE